MINHLPASGVLLYIVVLCGCGGSPSASTEEVEQFVVLRVEPPLVAFDALGDTMFLHAFRETSSGRLVAEDAVVWAVSPDSVAAIRPDGLVSSIGEGEALITVTARAQGAKTNRGSSGSADVTVWQRAASVGVSPSTTKLTAGETPLLSETRLFAVNARDAKGQPISKPSVLWTSSNGSVASVTDSGVVTGVSAGAASIVATVDGVTGTGSVTVWDASGPNNMPAGMTVTIDTDFGRGLPADGLNDLAFDFRYNSVSEDITAESGVSGSADGFVAQANYSIGYGGGSSPGGLWPGGNFPTSNSGYTKFRMRVSDPWDFHSTGTNKVLFVDMRDTGNENLFIGFNSGVTKDARLFVETQSAPNTSGRMYMNLATDAEREFNLGEWVWIEIYTDGPDDVIKVWVNGTLVLDEDGTGAGAYNYSLDGARVTAPKFDPVWGGLGDNKATNDYIQFDSWVVAYGDGTEF